MLLKNMTEIMATFFYLGKSPKAPGTVGTLGAIPLVFLFNMQGPYFYMIMSFILVGLSIFVSQLHEYYFETHDSGEIVIDEVVGFLVAMAWIPTTPQALIAAFVLFRFFDILKPFPISYIDRVVGGGVGVVADDLLAGIVTNVILQVIYTHTLWLGVQL